VILESKHTVPVTDASFATVVDQNPGLVVVDFWAEWCGPCKVIAPALEQLAEEYTGRVTVAKLDVDTNPKAVMRFNVRSIPTMMFFKGGRHVDTVVGAVPKPTLAAKFQQHSG
jgi:thioredoxin 1